MSWPKTYPSGFPSQISNSHSSWLCNRQIWSGRELTPSVFIPWAAQTKACCPGKSFPGSCLCQPGHEPTVNPSRVELRENSLSPDWTKPPRDGGENTRTCGWQVTLSEGELGCWRVQDCLKRRTANRISKLWQQIDRCRINTGLS